MPKDEWRKAELKARFGRTDAIRRGRPNNIKGLECPHCGGPMRPQVNRRTNEPFAGCVNFPHCKGTLPYPTKS